VRIYVKFILFQIRRYRFNRQQVTANKKLRIGKLQSIKYNFSYTKPTNNVSNVHHKEVCLRHTSPPSMT